MKKIEKRAVFCLLLAGALILGLAVFSFLFFFRGGDWVSFAGNRHLYNSSGALSVGRVLDRDGDVLTWVDDSGTRQWYDGETVREATLHAVGDPNGNIGSGALVAFAAQLSGYNPITGAYSPLGAGNDLYLTLDARYNYTAYQALNGHKGAVGVYNYKTGEILCMVSSPTFDPADPPVIEDGDERYDGVYINRFLSGTFIPGSIFKTVTLAAALDNIPDLYDRTWTCTGSTQVGDGVVTCHTAHGEQNIADALANSCNGVFAPLAEELGADIMREYAEKAGLTSRYKINGLNTAAGSVEFSDSDKNQLGWSGIGQGKDQVNPCAMMVYMGAIANGGKAAVPQLIKSVQTPLDIPASLYLTHYTGTLVNPDTAEKMSELLHNNVVMTYGESRFPNMDVCAKSGTGEVGGENAPNAWFTGFLRGEDTPYAFVVLVENGGSGSAVAGSVAAKVLDVIVNGY